VRRFQYPDVDTQPGPLFVGGGGGAPTIVVAASNATDYSKRKADFVCSGVNDHEVIQATLDAMDLGLGLGGRLLLSEGTFNCEYGWIRTSDLTAQSPVHIQGMGDATCLSFSGGTGIGIDMNSEDSTLSNLWVLGNDATNVVGVHVARHGVQIYSVKFERFDTGSFALQLTNLGDDIRVWGCFFDDCAGPGIYLSAGANDISIDGNVFTACEDSITVDGAQRVSISDNVISTGSASTTTPYKRQE
jgi:hypothetical protein